MKREEAIDILFGCIEAHSEEENEALDMAIEALKREDHDGCDGCRYEANHELSLPCVGCKQNYVDKYVPMPEHDREWIIGCIKHDGFVKTDRGDKANQIILDALSADRPTDGDLISRQAATSIPIIPKEHRKVFRGEDDAFETGWNEALACVNMLPSADRPRGEWIEETSWKYKKGGRNSDMKEVLGTEWLTMIRQRCSECNMVTMVDDSILYKYCPHCGAVMRSE